MNLYAQSNFKITISDVESENIAFNIPNSYIGIRTDAALAEIITDLSRSKLTNWLKAGHILINGKQARPKDKVAGDEEVVITPPFDEEQNSFSPENIELNVIYEDKQVIVINKPAGLTVHPGNGNWSGTLLNGLLYHYPELSNIPRAGIVHRLDKDTTGLMVVARTLGAQIDLVKQLQDRSVNRIYRAIVEGNPHKEGIINKNIGRDMNNRLRMTTLEFGGREAITRYRVLRQFKSMSYIECKLETGRTHQIRVHMKDRGHPLIGDPVYGTRKINYSPEVVNAIEELKRQALHAIKLSFIHPETKEPTHFKSRLAEDIRNLLKALTLDEEADFADDDWDNEDDNNWEVIYAYDH